MRAFNTCINHLALLQGTRFQIDASSYLRFRDAVKTMTVMSNGGFLAPSLAGRHPGTGNRLHPDKSHLRKLALLGGEILGTGMADPEVAGILNRLHPGDASFSDDAAEPVPNGFWQFNYSPMGLYRTGNAVVTMRGLTDTFRQHCDEAGRYSWWDYRQLAFPIQKLAKAHYVMMNIECSAEVLEALGDLEA